MRTQQVYLTRGRVYFVPAMKVTTTAPLSGTLLYITYNYVVYASV